MENESWQSCRMCGRDGCDGCECADGALDEVWDEWRRHADLAWYGGWLFLLLLLIGSIVLWHLLGAQPWEGGF